MSSGFYACQSHTQSDTCCPPHHTTHPLYNHPLAVVYLHPDIATMVVSTRLLDCTQTTCSESLRLKLQCTIRNAWQTSTLGKYENGINWFIIFCDNENIPSNYQLPTSEFLLCAFATSSTGLCTGDTISSDLSVVCAWHITNDVPYNSSLQLKYMLKGAWNLTPNSSK